MKNPYIGRWAVNGAGHLGKITGGETDERGDYRYVGENTRGEGWASYVPVILKLEDSKELDALVARAR